MCRSLVVLLIACGAVGLAGPAAAQQTVTGLSGNNLVTFQTSAPGTFTGTVAVTGLTPGDALVAIDYRPAGAGVQSTTPELVGIGYNSLAGTARVYTLNTATGQATSVNPNTLTIGAGLSQVTADFNPTPDAIRVVTSAASPANNNFRFPNGGRGTLQTDTPLVVANPSDLPNVPDIRATAYSRNVAGGGPNGRTTLYEIDAANNALVTQGSVDFFAGSGVSPNTGSLGRVATLSGITGASVVDLDIFSTSGADRGTAYISNGTVFFTLDLDTGVATSLGTLAGGISDFAVLVTPVPEPGSLLLIGAVAAGAIRTVRRRRT